MMREKVEEEKQRYTFQPKTDDNKLKVVKYNNYGGNEININDAFDSNKKRKVDNKWKKQKYILQKIFQQTG